MVWVNGASHDDFEAQFVNAVDTAEDKGTITKRRAKVLRNKANSPRALERIRSRYVHEHSEANKQMPLRDGVVDWATFFDKFFTNYLPLILKLFNIA